MEPDDLALSDVHIAEFHRKIGHLQVELGASCATTGDLFAVATAVTQDAASTNSQMDCDTRCPNSSDNVIKDADPLEKPLTACYEICRSRFVFESVGEDCTQCRAEAEFDEDGDLVVERQRKPTEVIYIDHTLSTRLKHVGLQVWQGALLLCDFILDNQKNFEDVKALELGGGVGLASIVMAAVAKKVICTDIGESVLALCEKNAIANQSLYRHWKEDQENVILVRELDWMKEDFTEVTGSAYHWRPEDISLLGKTTILFAADVIYDMDLTTAFFRTVVKLMSKPPNKILYLALEQRLNFTVEDLDVVCPAYNHFLSCLEKINSHNVTGLQISASQVETNFPQRFEYNRTKHLVLWKITSTLEAHRLH